MERLGLIVRLACVFTHGYIHPDEYFQACANARAVVL